MGSGVDPAAEAGRVAGRAVNALGLRLMRLRAIREMVTRAAAEASDPAPEAPPAAAEAPGEAPSGTS